MVASSSYDGLHCADHCSAQVALTAAVANVRLRRLAVALSDDA
jgi:hypothetical protein